MTTESSSAKTDLNQEYVDFMKGFNLSPSFQKASAKKNFYVKLSKYSKKSNTYLTCNTSLQNSLTSV